MATSSSTSNKTIQKGSEDWEGDRRNLPKEASRVESEGLNPRTDGCLDKKVRPRDVLVSTRQRRPGNWDALAHSPLVKGIAMEHRQHGV